MGWFRPGETRSICLQIVILFLAFIVGFESWLGGKSGQFEQEFLESAREKLKLFAVQADPKMYVRSPLLSLCKPGVVVASKQIVERKGKKLRRRGLNLSIYRFNKAGELIDTFPKNAANLWLVKNLFKGLISGNINQTQSQQLEKKLSFVFGDGKDLAFFKNEPGRVIDVFANNQEGCVIWNHWDNGGIIVHCPKIPDEKLIFANVSRFFKQKIGFGSLGSQKFHLADRTLDLSAGDAFSYLKHRKLTFGFFEGFWWFFQGTVSGRIVFSAWKPLLDPFERFRFLARGSGSVLLILVILWLNVSRKIEATRLRTILLVLFLVSAVIPLLALSIGSLDLGDVYQRVLGSRIEARQNEAILNIVQDFDAYLTQNTMLLNKLTAEMGSGKSQLLNRNLARKISDLNLLDSLQLRDSGGNVVFSTVPDLPFGKETMAKSFCRRAVELNAPQRLSEHSYEGNFFTDGFVAADDAGFGNLLTRPGWLSPTRVGDSQELLYFNVLKEADGPAAYVELKLPLSQAVVNYLKKKSSQRINFEGTSVRLYAMDIETFRWTIPPPGKLKREFKLLALKSWVTGQPQSSRTKIPQSGFTVCIPCPALSNHCLIAFCPDELLLAQISRGWRSIFIGGGIFLFLMVLLGKGISQNLVSPLKDLEEGAKALGNRDFLFMLPVQGRDELAQLFLAFNNMMIDSHDLQVAKRVQEGLIPHSFPKIEDYSIFGKIQTASDLGGDCLDCLPLPDGRMCFLVGDIAGHGVGAALIMAFTRAVTFHWSGSKDLSTQSLALELDCSLQREKVSKSFMGVICGILDSSQNLVEVTVAGHIYPIHLRKNGSCAWIGSPELPLGIGKKGKSFSTIQVLLDPGDSLFCATDGFIEATNTAGEQVGYENLISWINETRNDDTCQWIDDLFTRHSAWCERKAEDDITLFVLSRKTGGEV